jgi:hypothetical protein
MLRVAKVARVIIAKVAIHDNTNAQKGALGKIRARILNMKNCL